MLEPQGTFSSAPEDGDETLVTPRFDEEEAGTARPVVPLAVVSGDGRAPSGGATFFRGGKTPLLALALVSALIGGVAGGVGLYFYQRREQANAPVTDTPPAPAPATTEAPPSTAPAREPTGDTAAVTEDEAEPDARAGDEVQANEEEDKRPAAQPSEEARHHRGGEDSHAGRGRGGASRRGDENDNPRDRDDAPVKRGRKGEHDDATDEGGETRARRVDVLVGEPEPSPRAARAAEREEERLRRAERIRRRRERREQRGENGPRAVDRLRGIFEGQPPNE